VAADPSASTDERAAAAIEPTAIEHAAMERLAAWAYQWSSLVSYRLPDGPLLWLELGASRALFGGHARCSRTRGRTDAAGLQPCVRARALAHRRGAVDACRTAALRDHARAAALAARAAAAVAAGAAAEVLAALQSAGLRRIGQLLAAARRGDRAALWTATSLYLQRLCGTASDPRPAWRMPATYRARFEFGSEVHDTTALLFPLRRLLLEFQGYLRGRDCAVLRFTLEFEHYRHAASGLTIGMSAPARDAAQFLLLARERLQALVLPAPVSACACRRSNSPRHPWCRRISSAAMRSSCSSCSCCSIGCRRVLAMSRCAALRLRPITGRSGWHFVTPAAVGADPDTPAPARPCTLLHIRGASSRRPGC
jgi:Arc/MetJ family transcription regulator